jgi:glycosyltransferase involved in cell wall biosynthesis
MKIGHFMKGIWAGGGVGSYIRRVGEAQAKIGHEVVYLDLADSTALDKANANVSYINKEGDLLREARKLGLDVLHLHGVSNIAPGISDVPVVRSIHDHTPYCPSGSRYFQRWNRPCPRAFSITGCVCGHLVDRCGSIRPQKIFENFRRVRTERRLLARVMAVANSTFVADQMIRSGYNESLIRVLLLPGPESVSPAPLSTNDPARFLFLGRMVPEKGLRWLIESAALIKCPFILDVAGEGRERMQMERLAAELHLKDQVIFHGWVDQVKAFALMAQARAVIFPSVWHEPAGLVTLEAAANRRAVIASSVGGIPEYAEKLGNTILVPVSDRAALASAITELVADPKKADHLGSTGLSNFHECFSLKRHVTELDRIYQFIFRSKS